MKLTSIAFLGAATLALANLTAAESIARKVHPGFGLHVPEFQFLEPPARATARVSRELPAGLHGSSIAVLGERSLVIDEDSGELLLTGATGAREAALAIGPGAAQLVLDPDRRRAYVTDRMGDRLWVVDVGDGELTRVRRVSTPIEPYGLALTPDRRTLLVTTVADRRLVAYDTATMNRRWSVEIAAEPRGVAVAPDGASAAVTHLSTGTVTHVDLSGSRPRLTHTALNRMTVAPFGGFGGFGLAQDLPAAADPDRAGFAFARNAFAALHLPGGTAVVAYQVSTPQQIAGGHERTSSYGGGVKPPIEHRIAFIGGGQHRILARAQIGAHQPRALAYDGDRDTLYVAGLGNDRVTAIAGASGPAARLDWTRDLTAGGEGRCGPTGIAITDGGELRVFCSFRRAVTSVSAAATVPVISHGPALAPTRLTTAASRGRDLFHTGGDQRLSGGGAMACASCHPEGRADGLSWRIEGHDLQTPILAGGRLAGTHPFKWDGKDPNIVASMTNTVRRLGGTGIQASDARDLEAFFATLPAPRTPTVDSRAVARGKALFHSSRLGCASCHNGSKMTDGKRYDLADDLGKVDTPSLIGLAASAPYYHDGSAADLRALLLEKGSIHGMGRLDVLEREQVDDLVSFLRTL